MDPDGDYESGHSTRLIGDILPKDAKPDNVDEECNKKCGEDGFYESKGNDEEMGLKPSPKANTSKVLLFDENEGSIDLKASAPPAVDLGCLASAPPLEPSLHPSPEDDATAPTTPESSYPPEPPGFKDEPIERGGSIPDSVALPIGLDNADRALPIASVVPIITDATGAEIATPPTQPTMSSSTSNHNDSANAPPQEQSTSPTNYTADRAPSRRVLPYFRPVPTHPAHDEREKKGSQGWKCTPCKKALCLAVIIIVAVVAVGLTIAHKPKEAEPSFASLYPNCHVLHKEWIGDDECNGGNYNKRGCGWDGGDCIKQDWPNCHANTPEAFRGLGNGKCNAAFDVIECGFDLGDCKPNWSKDDVEKLKEIMKTYPGCYFDGMVMGWFGDGVCDGGLYDREVCGHDGGDCIVQGYPDCQVDDPPYIGDDECDGGQYNTEECGWDGGDCVDFNRQYPNCEVETPYYLADEFCHGGRYNTEECGWDGGDCVEGYPNCQVTDPNKVGDGSCDGGEYNTEECGWDGGDCLIAEWPNCHIDNPGGLGNGLCNKGSKADVVECGFDGGDCTNLGIDDIKELLRRYPNCHPDNAHAAEMNDGYCLNSNDNAECGWDGETVSSKGKTTSAMDQSAPHGPTKVAPGARTNALTKAAAAKLTI